MLLICLLSSREEDTAINGMYEINPAQNAGLEYQYDEVVRGREKRKRLLGEDCDDCREVYLESYSLKSRIDVLLYSTMKP